MLRLAFCLVIALTAPAQAQQASSMTPDQAYVRALSYYQEQIGLLRANAAIRRIALNAETASLNTKVAGLEGALAELRDKANALDPAARAALAAFAEGRGGGGIDALLAQAAALPERTTNEKKAKREAYSRAGELAEPVDSVRAVKAYSAALALDPYQRDLQNRIGALKLTQGDTAGAEAAFKEALDGPVILNAAPLSRMTKTRAAGLGGLSMVALAQGDTDGAIALQRAALGINVLLEDRAAQAENLENLGAIRLQSGEASAAEGFFSRALDLRLALSDRRGQAFDLGNLGLVAFKAGDLVIADAQLKQALGMNAELGDKIGQASALTSLGAVANKRADYPAAKDYFQRARDLSKDSGVRLYESAALTGLGDTAKAQGEKAGACENYRQALALVEAGAQTAADLRRGIGETCPR